MIENIIKSMKNNLSESEKIIATKKIGFSGYIAFKLQLERDLENKKSSSKNKIHSDIDLEDSLEEVTKKTLAETIEALNSTVGVIDYKNFETIIEKIRESGRILIIGAGMSSIVARDLELKLMKIKIDTVHYDSKQMQLMKLSTMNEKDLVIFMKITQITNP